MKKNIKNFNDEVFPLHCHFNEYHKCLVVLTKVDVRLFEGMTGKLYKVFTHGLGESSNNLEFTKFSPSSRDRKFYTGDNNGTVRHMNMNNGLTNEEVLPYQKLLGEKSPLPNFSQGK